MGSPLAPTKIRVRFLFLFIESLLLDVGRLCYIDFDSENNHGMGVLYSENGMVPASVRKKKLYEISVKKLISNSLCGYFDKFAIV